MDYTDMLRVLLQAAGIGLAGPVGWALANPLVKRAIKGLVSHIAKRVLHEYTRPRTEAEEANLQAVLAERNSPEGRYDRLHGYH
jgi:hypothetical protein